MVEIEEIWGDQQREKRAWVISGELGYRDVNKRERENTCRFFFFFFFNR